MTIWSSIFLIRWKITNFINYCHGEATEEAMALVWIWSCPGVQPKWSPCSFTSNFSRKVTSKDFTFTNRLAKILAAPRPWFYSGCPQAMILFWLQQGHDFILAAARPWFYSGCSKAMILFWLLSDHDFILAAVRSWFYSGCLQAMILFGRPAGHDSILAASRPWFYTDCRQAMILYWLQQGHDFILAAARPWFYTL